MTDWGLDGLWKASDNSFVVYVDIECLWEDSTTYLPRFSGTAQYVKGDMYMGIRELEIDNLYSLMPRRRNRVLRITTCKKHMFDDDKLVIRGRILQL